MCDPANEVYTLRVDSMYAPSNNTFVGFINIPLKNVIKAELLSASIHANALTTSYIYVYVEELVSKFNDRTNLLYYVQGAGTQTTEGTPQTGGAVSNVNQIATSIVAIPTEESAAHRTVFSVGNNYPAEVNFIEPIRAIEKLTVKLLTSTGALVATPDSQPTYLVFRFTCSKPNICQY
jgi:hypothetical protein